MSPAGAAPLQEEFARLWTALWPSVPVVTDLPAEEMARRIKSYRACYSPPEYRWTMVDAAKALLNAFHVDRFDLIPELASLGEVDDLLASFRREYERHAAAALQERR